MVSITSSQIIHWLHTGLCLGLNLAIPRIRDSRYARFVIALLILNEIRGLCVVFTAVDHGAPWLW